MKNTFEIHYTETSNDNFISVLVTKIKGPGIKKLSHKEEGFYISSAGHLRYRVFKGFPKRILSPGQVLPQDVFRRKLDFISKTTAKLNARKRSAKLSKKENTGIQITISNIPFSTVTHIQALPLNKLPRVYIYSNCPQVWQYKDELLAGDGYPLLKVGKSYTHKYLMKALRYIQLAGEHLTMVKQDAKHNWPSCPGALKFKDGKLV